MSPSSGPWTQRAVQSPVFKAVAELTGRPLVDRPALAALSSGLLRIATAQL